MREPHKTVLLIHHPTVALSISGFDGTRFSELKDKSIYLGNIYRRVMPASLTRIASVIEKSTDYAVKILDIRLAGYDKRTTYKKIDWEGHRIEAHRIGESFDYANNEIAKAEWLGLSSHFTFESGIIGDLIKHARTVNPALKIMVGGADVRVRAQQYLDFGADLAFEGDFDPREIENYDGNRRIVGAYKHPFEDLIFPAFDKLDFLDQYTDSHDGPTPAGVTTPIGFIYFTRGCPRECDFCESRLTGHESLDLEHAIKMVDHYYAAGIRSLNIIDDNLLITSKRPGGRDKLINLFDHLRKKGFAWEFPNGLEVGLLKNGKVDRELMSSLFSHTMVDGRIVGAYRAYVPIETFDHRDHYRKLKPIDVQNQIISVVSELELPEVDFGVVLPRDASEESFLHIEEGYREIKTLFCNNSKTKARYAVFHLIPIAQFRTMRTKYNVLDFPEGWNFHFPVYDGDHFSARQLFEKRLDLIKKIDFNNYVGMTDGHYCYTSTFDTPAPDPV